MLKLRPRDCLLFAGFMQLKEKAGGLKALAVAQTFSGACLQTVSYRQSQQGVIVVITIEEGHETAYRFEANGTHTFLVGENEPLPQQEKVTAGADDAPPVLAGDKGKYALGCKGGTDPARTYWPSGENGLNQTQEAFLEPIWKSRDRQLMPGRDNRDRLIRIHISKTKEGIHGYPLPE